jgi:hypothetical protein
VWKRAGGQACAAPTLCIHSTCIHLCQGQWLFLGGRGRLGPQELDRARPSATDNTGLAGWPWIPNISEATVLLAFCTQSAQYAQMGSAFLHGMF